MFRFFSGPCWDRTNDPPDMYRDALIGQLRYKFFQIATAFPTFQLLFSC